MKGSQNIDVARSDEMREIIERLNHLIEALPIRIKQFSEQEFSTKVSLVHSVEDSSGIYLQRPFQ